MSTERKDSPSPEQPERRKAGRRWAVIAAAAVAAVAVAVIGVQLASTSTAPRRTAAPTPEATASSTASPTAAPAPLSVAPGERVLIFGDSYTSGYGATPNTDGYAYLMGGLTGWDVTVDGMGGTGYLNPGPDGGHTFAQRIAALTYGDEFALVILEGGSNDQRVQGGDLSGAVGDVVTAMQQHFPSAELVMVGPAAIVGNENADKARVDDVLRQVAGQRSLPYISPLREQWFPAGQDSPYVNWSVGHPNNAGYARYAERLRDDLQALP